MSLKDLAICFGFFAAGGLYVAAYQKLGGDALKSAFEVLSFAATIAAAGVAAFTLTAWRNQWKHGESYTALKKLSLSLADLSCIDRYVRSYAQMLAAEIGEVDRVPELKALYKANSAAYAVAIREFRSALEDVHLLLGSDHLDGILKSPEVLSEEVRVVVQSVILMTYSSDPEQDPLSYALQRALEIREDIGKGKLTVLRLRSDRIRHD